MLSAFTARPIVELRQRDKSKIESILAYGDKLLVGLNTGSLRIYRVNEIPEDKDKQNGSAKPDTKPSSRPTSSADPKPVDLLREIEKFSTRAIEQLAIIKEANVLISLSNSYVSIHDLQTYTLQEQLLKTKSATTFAVTSNIIKDSATGIPEIISRLAVAVKRKVLLWSWHESELEQDSTEITLAEPIKTLTWASATKVICGMNSGYVIVDVTTQAIEEIVGPGAIGGAAESQTGRFGGVGSASLGYMGLGGYVPKPLATRLAEGEMLLAKDINSLFITSEGKPLEKRQIPWSQAPDGVGYSYPYILALLSPSQGTLEVRNPDTLSLLQSISLPSAKTLHFPPPTVSLAHAGKGFHVASERCIWRMGATNYDTQVDELVQNEKYDEAISVLEMLEDALLKNKADRLREIKILKAQMLFDQRKYQDAVDIFMAQDVQAPPERVIKLYPRLIAGDLTMHEEALPEASPEPEEQNGSTNGETQDPKHEVGSPKAAPINKLLKSHQKTQSDTSSIRSFMRLDGDSSTETTKTKPASIEERALEGKDLQTAVLALCGFLVQARNRMKAFLSAETGKLITSSNGNGNGNSTHAIDSLLTSPASSAEQDREKKLIETAKLIDTTLFRAYMLARPSLAGALFRIPNFCDPEVVGEKLLETGRYNDLVDFYHGKKLHRPALELLRRFGSASESESKEGEEIPDALKGPQRTVGYLQNLPPEMIDLILEFAAWPLKANPELGMEVFLADTENAETLPRDRVVGFLKSVNGGERLVTRYIEHVVNELDDSTPEFHNGLVECYLKELKGKGGDENGELMERLVAFLRSSRQYSLSKAFGSIPRDDPKFYEAQAVVLSNMGQHKQALEIYVFKIGDFEKAEEYCNRVHLTSDSVPSSPRPSTSESDNADPIPSIYHTLLSLYLTPPPPHTPNWPPALDLLSKHGSRLPASSTLNLIPATLPVKELESYFRGRIRAANSKVNESRVVVGLRKSEVVAAQAGLLLGEGVGGGGRNRRVLVGEERVCGGCHKRLGGSVIAVLPDDGVVHYGCLGKVGVKSSANGGMDGLRSSQWGR